MSGRSGAPGAGEQDAHCLASWTAQGKCHCVSQVTKLLKALGENQVHFGPRTGGGRAKILPIRRLIPRKWATRGLGQPSQPSILSLHLLIHSAGGGGGVCAQELILACLLRNHTGLRPSGSPPERPTVWWGQAGKETPSERKLLLEPRAGSPGALQMWGCKDPHLPFLLCRAQFSRLSLSGMYNFISCSFYLALCHKHFPILLLNSL